MNKRHPSLLRTFCFSAISTYDSYLPSIFNWKKCIDLRLFSKYFVAPFLRLLRSNDVWGWILRFRPQIVLGKSEKSAASLCITNVSKVLFISLFHSSLKTVLLECKRVIEQSNKSDLWNCSRGLPYFFDSKSGLFRVP